ncbi:hypothetical protein Hanom_Chr03g00192151 [Helianthus anomalus]
MQSDTARSSCRCFISSTIRYNRSQKAKGGATARADQCMVCFHWLLNVIPILLGKLTLRKR